MRERTIKETEEMLAQPSMGQGVWDLIEKRKADMLRQRVRRQKKKTWLQKNCKGLSPDGVIGAAMLKKCKIVWIEDEKETK